VRTSFSHILPMLGLNEESANHQSAARANAQGSMGAFLPPNTREHRLPDGSVLYLSCGAV
jgi:hypothetical protein